VAGKGMPSRYGQAGDLLIRIRVDDSMEDWLRRLPLQDLQVRSLPSLAAGRSDSAQMMERILPPRRPTRESAEADVELVQLRPASLSGVRDLPHDIAELSLCPERNAGPRRSRRRDHVRDLLSAIITRWRSTATLVRRWCSRHCLCSLSLARADMPAFVAERTGHVWRSRRRARARSARRSCARSRFCWRLR
jgi:hypothetical protein